MPTQEWGRNKQAEGCTHAHSYEEREDETPDELVIVIKGCGLIPPVRSPKRQLDILSSLARLSLGYMRALSPSSHLTAQEQR